MERDEEAVHRMPVATGPSIVTGAHEVPVMASGIPSTDASEPEVPPETLARTASVSADAGHDVAIGLAQPNRLQLIDEDQHFSGALFHDHLSQWGMLEAGFGYDICAVLGSQSTGKSTLLNRLFGTNFDVMDDRARQQTTKGIWLCRGMDRNVLVMDVEGTDGRERGEDQDFERKSALFSLATAECVIVNMWENQVGLFQGANMGLLKTVLDVNLTLFQVGRARAGAPKEKTLLLFVIRDYIGTTPLANLESTIRADLQRIWASLTKPEALAGAELGDFFDVSFSALPHKVLQAKEFDEGIAQLQRRFIDRSDPQYVFQTEYHKRIPIDGLPHYLESVWEQILQNKDLDLPTQQELLAQFRCDEIAAAAAAAFAAAMTALRSALDAGQVLATLGVDMASHRAEALAVFDKDASRYHRGVYARKRADLLLQLNAVLLPFFLAQLKNLHTKLASAFQQAMQEGTRGASYDFGRLVEEHVAHALAAFDAETQRLVLPDTDWSVSEERMHLEEDLRAVARTLRADETQKLAVRLEKDIRRHLAEPIEAALSEPDAGMWDRVLGVWRDACDRAAALYRERAAHLNTTPDEDAATVGRLHMVAWRALLDRVQESTSETVLASRLRAFFEDRFRYDASGVPRVWKPSDDMDDAFVQARDATLALIPLYATMQPETPPTVAGDEDTPSWDEARRVLSERRCAELGRRFRRDADAAYVEAKRGTVSSMTQVPWWMYVVLIVLGWNEAMAVLHSPVYFTLLCMVLASAYVVWRMNLAGPMLTVTTHMARELRALGEQQLRVYLDAPSAAHPAAPATEARPAVSESAEPRLPASF
ncbi:protein SEY1 [Malassezia restricta]|uniref:Protein SEY1 n=1 Tax=Malassezia restricta (strain ATCC 96810 / NBRC 103918 / CBS 7877) TaxID=425264 RepID=A0A3G2RZG1_MALR7|nr:protein SEY1 [Malassezia restricta]AXA48308.1 protein SEY1 [Malassezia restricta]AYO41173.1 Protein SEY1 [Malassezia restricta CBS 7877]